MNRSLRNRKRHQKISRGKLFLESLETRAVMDGADDEVVPMAMLFSATGFDCGGGIAIEGDEFAVKDGTANSETVNSGVPGDDPETDLVTIDEDGSVKIDDPVLPSEGSDDFIPCIAYMSAPGGGLAPEASGSESSVPAVQLERFGSADALQESLLQSAISQWENLFGTTYDNYVWPDSPGNVVLPYYYRGAYGGAIEFDNILVADRGFNFSLANSAATDSLTVEYHGTNVQVAGIGEADYVQTDGKYIYAAVGNRLVITDIQDPANLSVVSRTVLNQPVTNFYVQGDRLTVLSAEYPFVPDMLYRSSLPYLTEAKSHVTVYDISDRSHPTQVEDITIDGSLLDSRMVGDELVLVTEEQLSIPSPEVTCGDPTAITSEDPMSYLGDSAPQVQKCTYETREAYLERVSSHLLADILPQYTLSATGSNPALLTNPEQVVGLGLAGTHLITTSTIDLVAEHPDVTGSATVLAPWGSQIHVTENSVYLTAQRWNGELGESTIVIQFSLAGDAVSVTAAGEVPGHLVSPFAMNEAGGVLRLATTSGWGMSATNDVYVLAADGDSLEVIGSVTGITPGEAMQSARFVGDKAYLVTFLRTDPLVVVDLSDPTNPTVTGELEIPGFSSYLHPFGSYLIGLGQDADPNNGWTTNPQVSLFDASNPEQPALVDRVSIAPNSHSWSAGFYDYHAVNFYAEPGLFAVPIQLNEMVYMPVDFPEIIPFDRNFITPSIEWVSDEEISAAGESLTTWVDTVSAELPRLTRLISHSGLFGTSLNLGGDELLSQIAKLLPKSIREQLPEELPALDELQQLIGALPDDVREKLRSLRDSLPAELQGLVSDLFKLLDQPADELLRPRTGMWLFRVDPTAEDPLKLAEIVSHDEPVDRSFLVGNTLFTVSMNTIQSRSVEDLSEVLDEVHIGRLANDDFVTVDIDLEDQPVAVLENDHVPEGSRIIAVTTPARGGEAVIAEDGQSVIFTPADDATANPPFMIAIWPAPVYYGDSFEYTVELPGGETETATVTVNFEHAAANKRMTALAVADLATLKGVREEDIEVVYTYFQEWPDASLGIPNGDGAYAQVITPGFVVVLSLKGETFEYHTDLVQTVRLVPPAQSTGLVNDQFTVSSNSQSNVLDVLSNDFANVRFIRAPQISAVSEPEYGGTVSISADGYSLLYTPSPFFVGTERFRYTVDQGDSAEVVVSVIDDNSNTRDSLVTVRLELTDADGNTITNLEAGDAFYLNVYTDDLREDGEGIYASYADITFDAAVAKVDGAIEYMEPYVNGKAGNVVPGGIDELGAFSGSLATLGGEERLVVRVPMRATADGVLTVQANPADRSPEHDTTMYGVNAAIRRSQINYGAAQVVVGNIFHNAKLAADVDGDDHIAPIDALTIINFLNSGGSMGQLRQAQSLAAAPTDGNTSNRWMDTNGDGEITPQDVLIVINRINDSLNASTGNNTAGAAGESAGVVAQASNSNDLCGPALAAEFDIARLARHIIESSEDYASAVDAVFGE